MVALTFPDGARRDFPNGSTGIDIAKGISPSLAKRTVAMALDGVLTDLGDPIEHDAKIEFISRDDPRALELIRHDAAHVVGVYINDVFIKKGRLDTAAMKPIARCGYDEYAMVETVFKMTRPKGGG